MRKSTSVHHWWINSKWVKVVLSNSVHLKDPDDNRDFFYKRSGDIQQRLTDWLGGGGGGEACGVKHFDCWLSETAKWRPKLRELWVPLFRYSPPLVCDEHRAWFCTLSATLFSFSSRQLIQARPFVEASLASKHTSLPDNEAEWSSGLYCRK